MRKLRIGIIGAGGIAQSRHIPVFLKFSDSITITAVCDVNKDTAKRAASQFGIEKSFTNYKDMFSETDAVVICTPNKFHSEITVAALEAGQHVLCEKPMAMSSEECKKMVEARDMSGKVLAIAYHYRFMKEAQAAKKLILANEIGRPFVARARAMRRRKVPGWGVFTNKELQGGGSLIDYGCHLLDLSLWLMGNPGEMEVIGSAYNTLSKMPDQVNLWGSFDHKTFNVDDHVTAYIKFKNGASLIFETSWSANIERDEESVSLSGEHGGIDVFPFRMNQSKHGMLLNTLPEWLPGEVNYSLAQTQNFINACMGREEFTVKPEEALQTTRIIDAIYKSSGKREKF
ncbi:Gfo/Idh/MocA family oxidoreductase [Bacillus sp. ISL-47]|uniref:Gfo/Idh/MocA family protein n=1 Tax=Bacillus sp. ISL-47 TaxID=2819130 RepID=UPI001BECBF20|nr:Gfo/Idh/MocA family oxidoreductase [Bacillus sp. ISL-47]MBT2690673.1 Gfo/Idh/MocA family oxidoreductase [Bacillus sp. ISL-47]MBT2709618.1 Gfo/Idh/MocA family oxidoreductase [Pseudomonas sp. ISL-84]